MAKKSETQSTRIVPQGTMTALAAALPKEVITSGMTFFDPIDLLEDKLSTQPNLHARVLESMAWMMDSSCISQARSVLFKRYQQIETEHAHDVDFKGFCQTVAEDIDHESLYEEEGPESTLALLLALRNHWHDAAANAAATDDRDYKAKSLREQMETEKVKAADIGTRVNYRKVAELEGRGDAAKTERLYAAYMEADVISQTQRVEGNKDLMPVILEILHVANRYAVESSRFDELPLIKQKQLTAFVIGATDRSRTDIAKRLNRQPIAFGHLAEAAFEATEALNKVIVNKYSDIGELENVRSQTQTTMDRNAKRKAYLSID